LKCVDFFFNTASIAGARAITLNQLLNTSLVAFVTSVTIFIPGFTGISAGLPASVANPVGTVVPTNLTAAQIVQFGNANNPVVYLPSCNTFVVTESGLYEITYNIQGSFQFVCPTALQFALFVNNQMIPSSRTSIASGFLKAGEGFNVSKTFCLFFDKCTTPKQCCPSSLDTSNQNENSIQLRAIVDNDPNAQDCISVITNANSAGVTQIPATVAAFSLDPAGTLAPNNAFEIVFKRISDTCIKESSCCCDDDNDDVKSTTSSCFMDSSRECNNKHQVHNQHNNYKQQHYRNQQCTSNQQYISYQQCEHDQQHLDNQQCDSSRYKYDNNRRECMNRQDHNNQNKSESCHVQHSQQQCNITYNRQYNSEQCHQQQQQYNQQQKQQQQQYNKQCNKKQHVMKHHQQCKRDDYNESCGDNDNDDDENNDSKEHYCIEPSCKQVMSNNRHTCPALPTW
jgi:hypothetical protein